MTHAEMMDELVRSGHLVESGSLARRRWCGNCGGNHEEEGCSDPDFDPIILYRVKSEEQDGDHR